MLRTLYDRHVLNNNDLGGVGLLSYVKYDDSLKYLKPNTYDIRMDEYRYSNVLEFFGLNFMEFLDLTRSEIISIVKKASKYTAIKVEMMNKPEKATKEQKEEYFGFDNKQPH